MECGGKVLEEREGNYVLPTVISGLSHDAPVVLRETFAPIVYVLKVANFEVGIWMLCSRARDIDRKIAVK